jgi:predicted ABC-type ATPase
MTQLRVLIIAGPNGAGKTTFADEYLKAELSNSAFINADRFAAMLDPSVPANAAIQAARKAIEEMEMCLRNRRNFALETTLSGRSYLHAITRWQSAGYIVRLVYLRLNSAEDAVLRVRQRVAQGGHDIPEDVIRRRFTAGYRNFLKMYRPIVDQWELYNNSGPVPELLNWGARK